MSQADTPMNDVFTVDPGVRFRRMFDEAVLIHQDRAESLVLNDCAVSILELCDGHRSLADIESLLAQQFEVDPAALRADLLRFVGELRNEGVIRNSAENRA